MSAGHLTTPGDGKRTIAPLVLRKPKEKDAGRLLRKFIRIRMVEKEVKPAWACTLFTGT